MVVFVFVNEGARTLVSSDVELRKGERLTFDELLKTMLMTHSKIVVRLDEREVTVKMAAKADERGAVRITSAAATVISRLGAGNFIFFNVASCRASGSSTSSSTSTSRCYSNGTIGSARSTSAASRAASSTRGSSRSSWGTRLTRTTSTAWRVGRRSSQRSRVASSRCGSSSHP